MIFHHISTQTYEIDVKKLEIIGKWAAWFDYEIAKLATCIVSNICFVYKMYEVIFFLSSLKLSITSAFSCLHRARYEDFIFY